jgi:hypothetical protein
MERLIGRGLDYIGEIVTRIGNRPHATPGLGGGVQPPPGYAYALDNDNFIALDDDGARGMEAA